MPNPFSRFLHHLPHPVLHLGVLWNHLVELVVPWFSFAPGRLRQVAGVLLISFQVFLIVSGNLSFLNWLTIVPFLACLDDSWLARVLPGWLARRAAQAAQQPEPPARAAWGLVVLIGLLSIPPVLNMLSPGQVMNTSFDRFELVNSYGAFGSVGRERHEIVLEGSYDGSTWKAYEFKVKPGDPQRRPAFISPYHYRLDWLMWFAAMGEPDEYPWVYQLVAKLLHNDPGCLGLLASNPFPDRPPVYVRDLLYRYRFTAAGDPSPNWWDRQLLGTWLPPVEVSAARPAGWK